MLRREMPREDVAGVLQHVLPVDAGRSPETFRCHTMLIGQQLVPTFSDQPAVPAYRQQRSPSVWVQSKAVIVEEVELLRWRIWNGKARNAKRSIDRIRKVMHVYKEERSHHTKSAPSRRLWHALHDVDAYLRGQSSWVINYARRYRAGIHVGTLSITEGTANFLVNRRMNKSQQMRRSRRGADPLLQVRCAVLNGTLGSRFRQLFLPQANQNKPCARGA